MKIQIVCRLSLSLALLAASLVVGAFAVPVAEAEIVVTEIMYNPDSTEGNPRKGERNLVEWLEIYNAGDEPINVGGYVLQDEDGTAGPVFKGVVLQPGEPMVLIPDGVSRDQFQSAWGKGFKICPMRGWYEKGGIGALANAPSQDNEVLSLMSMKGEVIDAINYQDADADAEAESEAGWPKDSPDGPSIYLLPGKISAKENDNGPSWGRSSLDTHGAIAVTNNEIFDGRDVGSPGVVYLSDAETNAFAKHVKRPSDEGFAEYDDSFIFGGHKSKGSKASAADKRAARIKKLQEERERREKARREAIERRKREREAAEAKEQEEKNEGSDEESE